MRRLSRISIVVVSVAFLTLRLGLPEVRAVVVESAPVWPIPADAPPAPPPIPSLPAAGPAQPPAELISDPVTPTATCTGWHLQGSYGERWASSSTWWEYRCTYQIWEYHNTCPGPACDAFCPSCATQTRTWADYFYWNGSDSAFYGEAYADSVVFDDGYAVVSTAWWDGPTARWYTVDPGAQAFPLFVALSGDGFGSITSSPAGIQCPGVCVAAFAAGTVVTLTATPDANSVVGSWTGDCFGFGNCQVTMNGELYVWAWFASKDHVNVPPSASFTATCAELRCVVNDEGSTDADGFIVDYLWDFGDGSSVSGVRIVSHTYAQAGSYVVTLTTTDNLGATGTESTVVTVAINIPPVANFTATCSHVVCTLDGRASTDVDGSIATYLWDFGDAAIATGALVYHTYAQAGSYTVTLRVTDNLGAVGTASKVVNPITLMVRGDKYRGVNSVDLSWSGAGGTSFDVFRDGVKVATVSTTTYSETVGRGSRQYTYEVCDATGTMCSNEVTVGF
jgi:PKD repeat protein